MYVAAYHRHLHSFPTRRSSDLAPQTPRESVHGEGYGFGNSAGGCGNRDLTLGGELSGCDRESDGGRSGWNCRRWEDRKSTRLNSSHPSISYAVFCLKKKNIRRLSRARAMPRQTSTYSPSQHLFRSWRCQIRAAFVSSHSYPSTPLLPVCAASLPSPR